MSGFDDKGIDIVIRLEECADIDEAEGATLSVVNMTREAADAITLLRKQRDELLEALKAIRGGEIQPATVAMFAADVISKAEA